jgi:hypothetical protein
MKFEFWRENRPFRFLAGKSGILNVCMELSHYDDLWKKCKLIHPAIAHSLYVYETIQNENA